jgi:hypothetical protein
MFTAEQYRAKAAEYDGLAATAQTPAEAAAYRELMHSYASHAQNLDWLATNAGKTVNSEAPDVRQRRDRDAAYTEQENILRCLGAAVILKWNTIPTPLQRELFEAASTIQGVKAAPLRDVLAQFLHDHKNDAQRAPVQETRT